MILGFSTKHNDGSPTNFDKKILSGVKKHTIREDKHCRWNQGMKIHFATGVRTKNYKQFATGIVDDIEFIEIDPNERTAKVGSYGNYVYPLDIEELAADDGFDSVEQFWQWFNKPFRGKIIYFKDVRAI